jgi:hypothetical protein
MLCEVTSVLLLTWLVSVVGDVPNSTRESAGSFVVHVTAAVLPRPGVAATCEMTGGVSSTA